MSGDNDNGWIMRVLARPVADDFRSAAKWMMPAATLFLAANLILIIVGQFLYLQRSPINPDYFWLALLLPWLRPRYAAIAFTLLFFFDSLVATAYGFHFGPTSLMQSIGDLFRWNDKFLVATLLPILVVFYGIYRLAKFTLARQKPEMGGNVLLFVFGMALWFATGSHMTPEAKGAPPTLLTSSSVVRQAAEKILLLNGGIQRPSAYDIPAATSALFDRLETGDLPPKIVLIVVESLGYLKDEGGNELQLSALENPELLAQYDVAIGDVPFLGSTVPGEVRELCRAQIFAVHPDASLLPLDECLPRALSAKGYATIAYHGFGGSMFSRREWYDEMGFDERHFKTDIEGLTGEENCGINFRGPCDHHVLDLIHARLASTPETPEFLYFLTLTAHAIVPEPPVDRVSLDCSRSAVTQQSEEVCRLVRTNGVILEGVVKAALDPDVPETIFVIVGDHSPPILQRTVRDHYSNNLVPYAVLTPKKTPDVSPDTGL